MEWNNLASSTADIKMESPITDQPTPTNERYEGNNRLTGRNTLDVHLLHPDKIAKE